MEKKSSKKVIHNLAKKKKNQSAETNSQIMQMLEVTIKTTNSYNNHIPHIQENSRKTEHVRDMEDMKGGSKQTSREENRNV